MVTPEAPVNAVKNAHAASDTIASPAGIQPEEDPETYNGYADDDGCPDLDNDGDGIADAESPAVFVATLRHEGPEVRRNVRVTLKLREDRKLKTEKKKRRDTAATLASADQPLFEALRMRRKEIAERLDLPPYVIFHDATLRQMAEHRPQTEAELLSISGVGEAKLERYGSEFLEVIAAA